MMSFREFFGAWRGIWLFTWRNQFTWRKLPGRVLGLLALPFLIYITTFSVKEWARRHGVMGPPERDVMIFAQGLNRSHLTLQPQQQAELRQIFHQEYARTELEWQDDQNDPLAGERNGQRVEDCYKRIRPRAKAVLDDGQFAQLQNFTQRRIDLAKSSGQEPVWRWTRPFYYWLVDFYFFVILPLGCIRGAGALIRDELQANTLSFLTTRPLHRHELLLLKFLAQTAWQQVVFLVETLLLFAVGWVHHIPDLGPLLPLFMATQFLAVFAWNALGLLFGLITRRYLALTLLYGAVVELGIGRIPTNINTLSLIRHLTSLLMHNLTLEGIYEWSGKGTLFSVGALLLATVLYAGVAAALFTFREYHPVAEMQK